MSDSSNADVSLEFRIKELEKQVDSNETNKRLDSLEITVQKLIDIMHGNEDRIDDRGAIDDLRLLRQFIRRFKSAKFIFGVVVGALTFIATLGYGLIILVEFLLKIFKTKGG